MMKEQPPPDPVERKKMMTISSLQARLWEVTPEGQEGGEDRQIVDLYGRTLGVSTSAYLYIYMC
jgi:hypothetical protein